MPSAAREFFTVDLRGLRAALTARAARDGVTESDVLRSALAAALGQDASSSSLHSSTHDPIPSARQTAKLSIRLSYPAAHRPSIQNARAAGLSRDAYLMRLINGASPFMASTDRAAGFTALSASANETRPAQPRRAAREFAKIEFADHRYVMVLHDHQANPHVHLSVKTGLKHGVRLNPRKADLHRWREVFAQRLQEWGIDAEATRRATRGEWRKPDPLWRIKAKEEGRLQACRPRGVSGAPT